jgi:hypothetical protein
MDKEELLETLTFQPEAIQAMAPEALTQELICVACASDGRALAYVPPPKRSLEACVAALGSTPLALAYVPDDLLGHERLRQAIRQRTQDFEGLWPHLTKLSLALQGLHRDMEDEDFWAGISLRT